MNEPTLRQWQAQALTLKPYPNPIFPPSPYYRFLRVLAQNIQPKLSVELGVCGGGGSLHLAMGWYKGTVVGIDVVEDHMSNTDYIKNKYPNFKLWIGDSVELAQSVRLQYGQVDILFIDTLHTYDQTMKEYNAWLPYMADNYVICFDDLFRPGMDRVWDELPEPKLRMDNLHDGAENGGGFGVIWNG